MIEFEGDAPHAPTYIESRGFIESVARQELQNMSRKSLRMTSPERRILPNKMSKSYDGFMGSGNGGEIRCNDDPRPS